MDAFGMGWKTLFRIFSRRSPRETCCAVRSSCRISAAALTEKAISLAKESEMSPNPTHQAFHIGLKICDLFQSSLKLLSVDSRHRRQPLVRFLKCIQLIGTWPGWPPFWPPGVAGPNSKLVPSGRTNLGPAPGAFTTGGGGGATGKCWAPPGTCKSGSLLRVLGEENGFSAACGDDAGNKMGSDLAGLTSLWTNGTLLNEPPFGIAAELAKPVANPPFGIGAGDPGPNPELCPNELGIGGGGGGATWDCKKLACCCCCPKISPNCCCWTVTTSINCLICPVRCEISSVIRFILKSCMDSANSEPEALGWGTLSPEMPLRGLSRLLGLSTSAALELVGLAGRTEELRLGLTGVLLAVLSSRSKPSSCRHCATKLASKFELSAKSKSWCQNAPSHNFRLKTTSSATMRIIYIILDINPADLFFTFFPLEPNVVVVRSKNFDLFDLQLANWSKKTTADFKHLQYLVQKKRPQLLSKFYFETKLCYQTSSTCTKQNKLRSSLKPLHWSFVKWSLSIKKRHWSFVNDHFPKKTALIICKWPHFLKSQRWSLWNDHAFWKCNLEHCEKVKHKNVCYQLLKLYGKYCTNGNWHSAKRMHLQSSHLSKMSHHDSFKCDTLVSIWCLANEVQTNSLNKRCRHCFFFRTANTDLPMLLIKLIL